MSCQSIRMKFKTCQTLNLTWVSDLSIGHKFLGMMIRSLKVYSPPIFIQKRWAKTTVGLLAWKSCTSENACTNCILFRPFSLFKQLVFSTPPPLFSPCKSCLCWRVKAFQPICVSQCVQVLENCAVSMF